MDTSVPTWGGYPDFGPMTLMRSSLARALSAARVNPPIPAEKAAFKNFRRPPEVSGSVIFPSIGASILPFERRKPLVARNRIRAWALRGLAHLGAFTPSRQIPSPHTPGCRLNHLREYAPDVCLSRRPTPPPGTA